MDPSTLRPIPYAICPPSTASPSPSPLTSPYLHHRNQHPSQLRFSSTLDITNPQQSHPHYLQSPPSSIHTLLSRPRTIPPPFCPSRTPLLRRGLRASGLSGPWLNRTLPHPTVHVRAPGSQARAFLHARRSGSRAAAHFRGGRALLATALDGLVVYPGRRPWGISGISNAMRRGHLNQSVSQSVSQSFSQSVSQSVSHSVGRSVGRWVGRSVGRSVNRHRSIYQAINQSISQSISQSINPSINSSINSSISQSVNQPTNQPTNQPNQSTTQCGGRKMAPKYSGLHM